MTKTIHVRDFKGVREITLQPTGSLVVIAGANGAGKSSLIDAITELFDPSGAKLTPKPIREGADDAVAEYVDDELGVRVRRVWKENGTAGTLTVEALDGARYSKPSQVVAELTGGLIWDPVKFLNLDEKRQRDALLEKVDLPFDVDALARERAGAKQRRLEAGRDVKRLQGALASLPKPSPDAPVEEISGAAVLAEIEAARLNNSEIQRWGDAAAEIGKRITFIDRDIDRLQDQIDELRRERIAEQKRADDFRARAAGTAEIDLAPLQAKLMEVDQSNAAVRAAREYSKVQSELAAALAAQQAAQNDLDDIEEQKRAGLAAAAFPVDGLSVDESGVTFDGIPFAQVNSAMRRRVAFAIATAGDPKLRLVIVKDGDLLDADSLAAIREIGEERGYTVLVERDRDESRQIGFTIQDGALA
jgi:ABC-type dipeptide/oligopeptide/nickel transport system ATPase component